MDFDNYLHRPIAPGTQYNNLIPKPKYNKVLIGEGNTDYSIEEMSKLVKESSYEAEALAEELKQSSLSNCVANVKHFAFNHFQYHADDADQMLRTLAYSWWVDRQNGIDCKSYSILVSSILTEMGINHYIRKIKQPAFAPTEYTHVYVVVPIDQQTNDLQKGYYTIDGTLETDNEPAYVGTKDKFMSGLQHYKLNAPVPLNNIDFNSVLKKIGFSSVKNIFNSISCWGGSAYGGDLLTEQVNKLNAFFNDIVVSIANNISKGDYKELSNDIADFTGYSECLLSGSRLVNGYGDWNSCTTNNISAFEAAALFYRTTVNDALMAYIDKYFDKTIAGKHNYTTTGLEAQGWRFVEIEGRTWTPQIEYYNLTPKTGLTSIPAFEFTQPLVDATSQPFDLQKFLNSLSTTITIVKAVTNPNGNGTGVNYNEDLPDNKPTTSQAGLGWLLGVLIVYAGYKLATAANEAKPNVKQTNKTTK